MASVNQTRPHCVHQMGKTHSKLSAAQYGRGTAWARHAMCESALTRWNRNVWRGDLSADRCPESRSSVFLYQIQYHCCHNSRGLPNRQTCKETQEQHLTIKVTLQPCCWPNPRRQDGGNVKHTAVNVTSNKRLAGYMKRSYPTSSFIKIDQELWNGRLEIHFSP